MVFETPEGIDFFFNKLSVRQENIVNLLIKGTEEYNKYLVRGKGNSFWKTSKSASIRKVYEINVLERNLIK